MGKKIAQREFKWGGTKEIGRRKEGREREQRRKEGKRSEEEGREKEIGGKGERKKGEERRGERRKEAPERGKERREGEKKKKERDPRKEGGERERRKREERARGQQMEVHIQRSIPNILIVQLQVSCEQAHKHIQQDIPQHNGPLLLPLIATATTKHNLLSGCGLIIGLGGAFVILVKVDGVLVHALVAGESGSQQLADSVRRGENGRMANTCQQCTASPTAQSKSLTLDY